MKSKNPTIRYVDIQVEPDVVQRRLVAAFDILFDELLKQSQELNPNPMNARTENDEDANVVLPASA